MLIEQCPKCGKRAHAIKRDRNEALKSFVYTLECGHIVLESIQNSLVSTNGRVRDELWLSVPRQYQREGVEFIERTNYCCLLGDDVGLGKTIQALLAVRYNRAALTPCLVIVKGALKYQWASEIIRFTTLSDRINDNGESTSFENMPFIIKTGNDFIPAGFSWYIISMDILKKYPNIVTDLGIKCAIIDESQAFKESGTARTLALTQLLANIPHKIFLSATPILNRASEYFTTLNLIDPRTFYSKASFERNYCAFDYNKNRYGGIASYAKDDFDRITSAYILRRLKSDVAKDLPKFSRYFEILDIDDPLFKKEYRAGQQELINYLAHAQSVNKLERHRCILALLAKLRKIVGMAKVKLAVEWAEDFLDSTDRKLCIGIHHQDVGHYLTAALAKYNPVCLTGGLSPEEKLARQREFESGKNRIMIASTLAAGEGLNLQFCSDALLLERQWNCAKEMQFEGRFHRIGQTVPVEIHYLIAKNSLDEWITNLVNAKRQYVESAMNTEHYEIAEHEETFNDAEIDYMQLAEMTASMPF